MDIKELEKELKQKRDQEKQLESAYLQVLGQRSLLEYLIDKEKNKKEKPKEDSK